MSTWHQDIVTPPASLRGFASTSLEPVDQVAVSDSATSGVVNAAASGGQFWRFRGDLPLLTRAEEGDWWGFLHEVIGRFAVRLGDPMAQAPQAPPGGTPAIVSGAKDSNLIVMDGLTNVSAAEWTADSTTVTADSLDHTADASATVMAAGDYLQVTTAAGKVRLFLLTRPGVPVAGTPGRAELTVWPRLREDLTPADAATFDAPRGVFVIAQAIDSASDLAGRRRLSALVAYEAL